MSVWIRIRRIEGSWQKSKLIGFCTEICRHTDVIFVHLCCFLRACVIIYNNENVFFFASPFPRAHTFFIQWTENMGFLHVELLLKKKYAKHSDWQKTVTSFQFTSLYIFYNQIGFALNLRTTSRTKTKIECGAAAAVAILIFSFCSSEDADWCFGCIRNHPRSSMVYIDFPICCEIGKWCMKITSIEMLPVCRCQPTKIHLIFVWKPLTFFISSNKRFVWWFGGKFVCRTAFDSVRTIYFYRIWGWTPLHAHFVLGFFISPFYFIAYAHHFQQQRQWIHIFQCAFAGQKHTREIKK